MAGIGDVFGRGSIGEQLFVWGLLSQVVQALTDPAISELRQLVSEAATVEPLSPAEAAAATIRGYLSTDSGKAAAARSGIDGGKFDTLVQLAGSVPPPEVLIEAMRRGLMDWEAGKGGLPSVAESLRRTGIHDQYAPVYRALAVQLPTWNDALDALLQGQLTHDVALSWYLKAGGDPEAFQWLFDARGTAPTPDMLGTMANRGIIPWTGEGPPVTSFHQGFLEGPWRNKWEAPMRQLMAYHPPPRTVTALLRAGTITEAEALTLFKQQGLSPELAAAYVKDAQPHHAETAKHLSQAQVEQLYADHVIDQGKAHDMLVALGYDPATATVMLTGADVRRVIAHTNAAITKVRALYVARKLSKADAAAAAKTLGLDPASITKLMSLWDIERTSNVKVLSEAQIIAAFKHSVLDQAEAEAELVAQGYSHFDVWVLLSNANGAPLPGKPVNPGL